MVKARQFACHTVVVLFRGVSGPSVTCRQLPPDVILQKKFDLGTNSRLDCFVFGFLQTFTSRFKKKVFLHLSHQRWL